MGFSTGAYVISANSHSADVFRRTMQTLIAGSGVVEAGDLAVTQNGTPNMSANVAAGMLWAPGTLGATTGFGNNINSQTFYGLPSGKTAQGMYCAYQDGTVNVGFSTADPANPRIDLVVGSIQDAQYAGVSNAPVLQVITGTPNASPIVPAAPASTVVLAQVLVGAGVTSIVTANITDKRPIAALNGGIPHIMGGSTLYPLNPTDGRYIDDVNLGLLRYSAGASAWQVISRDATKGGGAVTTTIASSTAGANQTWASFGTITVPAWATRCVVSYTITGIISPASLGNTKVGLLIGTSLGTLQRMMETVSSGRFYHTYHDLLTAVPTGSQTITLITNWAAGSSYTIDTNSSITCAFHFLP